MSYDLYGSNFVIKAKQTVFKWWYVVYKPVYKLTHGGRWPEEKQQQYETRTMGTPPKEDTELQQLARQMATQIQNNNNQHVVDEIVSESKQTETHTDNAETHTDNAEIDTTNVDEDVLDRANEIMARLAREAAEDEAKKQAEIDAARKKAAEAEQLASIMKANQVDISSFIEEGKAHQTSAKGDITL